MQTSGLTLRHLCIATFLYRAVGRKTGTRVKLTEENKAVIHQLFDQGATVASITRTVGLTRKTIYKALERRPVEV